MYVRYPARIRNCRKSYFNIDTARAPIYPSRDGGTVGTLAGNIVWFWSDTEYQGVNGSFQGFYGNSEAFGSAKNPLLMTGPVRQAIPYTTTEAEFNTKYSNNPR